MQTAPISFCDQSGLNVKCHDVKEAIVKSLENKYRVRIIQRHFDKLERPNQLPKLQTNPHLVCLRSNGNPYYLYLTRHQFINQCFFVDKKVQSGYDLPRVIISKLRFANELFEEDTLLEGEMVKDAKGSWIYLIHDLLVYKGRYLENEPLVKRLNILYDILANSFKPDDLDVCAIQVKKYVTYDRIKELVYDVMQTLPYTCRGLYFKPLYLRFLDFLFNFDESLIIKVERIKYQRINGFNGSTEEVCAPMITQVPAPPAPPTPHANSMSVAPSPAPAPAPAPSPSPSPSPTSPTILTSPKVTSSVSVSASLPLALPVITSSSTVTFNANEKIYLIEKTHIVDVYNLLEPSTKKHIGIASVVQASISRMLQDVFIPVNPTTRFLVRCTYHDRFQKWMPLQILGSAKDQLA